MEGGVQDMDSAWCVPLVASIATFLLTMPFTCFGLLYVLVMEKFGTSREQGSWIESAFIMSSNLSALAVAFLQRRIALPNIVLMASVLTSAAVVASALAPNIIWMSIIFGGVYGFAVKLFMAGASIYAMLFFDKYRATAQSFISCAQGAAGMAGQPLLSWLEKTYGLAGALVILGGILMHAVPLAMLFKQAKRIRLTFSVRTKLSSSVASIDATPAPPCSKTSMFVKTAEVVKANEKGSSQSSVQYGFAERKCFTRRKTLTLEQPRSDAKEFLHGAALQGSWRKHSILENCSVQQKASPSRSTDKIIMPSSGPEQCTPAVETIPGTHSGSMRLSLSLFGELAFYVLVTAIVVGDYTEIVFVATAVEYGEDKSLSMEASEELLMLWFLGQFLGSGLMPVIADSVGYSRSSFYVMTFALSSISLAVLPHLMEIPSLSILLPIHGMAMGFIRCVKCVVIAEQVGTERTAACWGISGLAIIPLSLANPVIIGFFRDTGGSYDNFYRMLGGINLFVTILFAWFLVYNRTRKSANGI